MKSHILLHTPVGLNDHPITLFSSHIQAIESLPRGSRIQLSSTSIMVRETREEIFALLEGTP